MSVKSPAVFSSSLFIAIACVYAGLALKFPVAYIWGTYEDLFGEWIQFWCFVVTFGLSVRIVFARGRYRWFFAMCSLGCFYVAMEEISWGQRIVGFTTPPFFKEHNLQGETNLHNLLTGPYSTLVKDSISYLQAAVLIGFGFAYPVALRMRFRMARWLDRLGVAAPPLYLWPFFVTAACLSVGLLNFNEAEVAEVLAGFAAMIMALHYRFVQGTHIDGSEDPSPILEASPRLTARIVRLTVAVLNLSALTTLSIYATTDGSERINKRIQNGVEKFAGRYARYENWTIAAQLYGRLHAENPRSLSTIRHLAECHLNLGDSERSSQLLQKALTIDLAKHRNDPGAASVNRSLVRTYRMLGDRERAKQHLDNALAIGLDRIEEHPDSANAAYSLGRTYALMGAHGKAFEQFARAMKLKPTSKKIRKAYYRGKNRRSDAS